jgi:hypothetical protein
MRRMDTCLDTFNKKGVSEALNPLILKVPPAGIEPATPGLGNQFLRDRKGLKILNYPCLPMSLKSSMVSYIYS